MLAEIYSRRGYSHCVHLLSSLDRHRQMIVDLILRLISGLLDRLAHSSSIDMHLRRDDSSRPMRAASDDLTKVIPLGSLTGETVCQILSRQVLGALHNDRVHSCSYQWVVTEV